MLKSIPDGNVDDGYLFRHSRKNFPVIIFSHFIFFPPYDEFTIQNGLFNNDGVSWILHELEASIGKAFKGEAIVNYASALITQHMGVSDSPAG